MRCHRRRWPYARLRHRIFVSIVASILVTAVFVILSTHLLDGGGYRNELQRVESFVTRRFADAWHDPVARQQLAKEIESTFNFTVKLTDASGHAIYGHPSSCAKPTWHAVIRGDSGTLGMIGVCMRHPPPHVATVALGLLAGLLFLWGASGAITWRLVRPIDELQRVTREIGHGNLAARMRLRRHRHDEIGEIADAVNDMAMRIERQVSDQRELLAGVSHEIRTPLARLRVLVELERSSPEDPKRLDTIEAELIEIDGLVGQLLAQSKLDFSALDKRKLSANDLAAAALERAGLPATLLTGVEGDDWVLVDPGLIARALANIIDNAQRHGAGLIELTVTRSSAYVQFAAVDAGPGIDGSVATRLFTPFERGGDKAGLGLGLSLVERISRAHGGHAFASPREGAGAVVGFRIPALRDSQSAGHADNHANV
jgi:two-component system, OmpR family, sensor kinase